MKRIMLALGLLVALCTPEANAQETWSAKKAAKWSKTKEWANGFTLAKPDKTTDYAEFAAQYHNSKETWDKLFTWLAEHSDELATMKPGRYEVDGTKCFVNVQDAMTKDADKCDIESHRNYIDLQYVVTGTERFGLVAVEDTTPKTEYRPDIQFYTAPAEAMKYVDSTPKTFFLFFPRNYHQALVKADKAEPVRKIVGKIAYVAEEGK